MSRLVAIFFLLFVGGEAIPISCRPGWGYDVNVDLWNCHECEPGTFSDVNDLTSCKNCALGTTATSKGSASCEPVSYTHLTLPTKA